MTKRVRSFYIRQSLGNWEGCLFCFSEGLSPETLVHGSPYGIVILFGNYAALIPGGFMKKFYSNSLLKILSTLFVCAALAVSFASCKQNEETGFSSEEKALAALDGTFAGSYESYTIDTEEATFDAGSYSYAGDNLTVDFTSDDYTEGYIYIKYTRAYELTTTEPDDVDSWTAVCIWTNNADSTDVQYSEPEDSSNYTKSVSYYFRYSTTAPDVGKYYAISFKELTDSSISLSGAYLYGGKTSTDTLEEAKETFTIANGYFSLYSELAKQ